MTLVVYSDYVCPFCYLAEPVIRRVREETGVETAYRAYELRPAPVPLLDPREGGYADAFRATIAPLASALGVEIRLPDVAPRSRKAHEAAAFARENGAFDAVHAAIFRAYWVEGLDVGRIDVLVEIGRGVGLDPTALKVALDLDQYTGRVEREEQEALRLGVSGVPSFRGGDELLVGLQPPEVLAAFVRETALEG